MSPPPCHAWGSVRRRPAACLGSPLTPRPTPNSNGDGGLTRGAAAPVGERPVPTPHPPALRASQTRRASRRDAPSWLQIHRTPHGMRTLRASGCASRHPSRTRRFPSPAGCRFAMRCLRAGLVSLSDASRSVSRTASPNGEIAGGLRRWAPISLTLTARAQPAVVAEGVELDRFERLKPRDLLERLDPPLDCLGAGGWLLGLTRQQHRTHSGTGASMDASSRSLLPSRIRSTTTVSSRCRDGSGFVPLGQSWPTGTRIESCRKGPVGLVWSSRSRFGSCQETRGAFRCGPTCPRAASRKRSRGQFPGVDENRSVVAFRGPRRGWPIERVGCGVSTPSARHSGR